MQPVLACIGLALTVDPNLIAHRPLDAQFQLLACSLLKYIPILNNCYTEHNSSHSFSKSIRLILVRNSNELSLTYALPASSLKQPHCSILDSFYL